MHIKLSTIMSGPAGSHQPGDVIEVDDKTGDALIAGNYGSEFFPLQKSVAAEQAIAVPAENTAMRGRQGKRAKLPTADAPEDLTD